MFKVLLCEEAYEDLEKITNLDRRRILKKVNLILANNPFPKGKNPKRLKGCCSFRLRVSSYRVLYEVDDDIVKIYAVGQRKNIYKRIK